MSSQIILAIVIGLAFGFVLDRIGAANPNMIVRMLNFSNLHLMKTILLGIGVASILMFAGLITGLVDPGHLSVKAAYTGVFLGGILLGVGWAVSGYCPGTSLVGAGAGRIDALAFVAGGLVGAAAYMGSYAWVKSTGVLTDVLGGKSTLGQLAGTKYPALIANVPGEWIGLGVGVLFIAIAWLLPDRPRTLEPAGGRRIAAAE